MRHKTFSFAFVLIFAGLAYGSAPNIYLSQSGGGSGAACSSALPASFFNQSSNWGAGSAQIGPGSVVHLCGTVSPGLAFQGSGKSGSPITLKFEAGASISAAFITSGISANGVSYIAIDGTAGGVIQATANGTGLANQKDGRGIDFANVSNSEIKGVTFSNLYQHTSISDEAGQEGYALFWNGGSNNTIDGNTCHDVRTCFLIAYAKDSNLNIFGNTIYRVNWGIVIGSGNTNAVLNGPVTIHDNVLHDFANWDDTANSNHHDGIYCFAGSSGASLHACSIYNNYIYGDPGIHTTAWIFTSQNTGGINCDGIKIFNNVLVNGSATNFPADALVSDWCTGTAILNNTFHGTSTTNQYSRGIIMDPGTGANIGNNAFDGVYVAVALANSGVASVANMDYNNVFVPSYWGTDNKTGYYGTLADWRACTVNGCPPAGHDAHSSNANPLLDTLFVPMAGSALIGTGGNLTTYGVDPAILLDKNGVLRPATGPWDIGALQSGSSVIVVPPIVTPPVVTPPVVTPPVVTKQPLTCTLQAPASVTVTPGTTNMIVFQLVCPN